MNQSTLLSITEMGGYKSLEPLYEMLGLRVIRTHSQRKALKLFKQEKPDIIVSEFIFQPDFRDRYCNVGTLTSQFPLVNPDVKLILLYDEEDLSALGRFARDFVPYHRALPHPVNPSSLESVLRKILNP